MGVRVCACLLEAQRGFVVSVSTGWMSVLDTHFFIGAMKANICFDYSTH